MCALIRCIVALTLALGAVGQEKCFPPDSVFAREGCRCGSPGRLTCDSTATLTDFPVLDGTFPYVTELRARDKEFSELNRSHLRSFPNLTLIDFNDGKISKISNDAFASNMKLEDIHLDGNSLTNFPNVANLPVLRQLFLADNNIRTVNPGVLDGCRDLITLELQDNDIRELKYGIFKDQVSMTTLNLDNNRRLSSIDENVFENTANLNVLRLNKTDISNLPSNGIRGSLRELYLADTMNLKRFDAYETGAVYYNQTYPFLRIVSFFYHAHCCQMQDHRYYVPKTSSNSRGLAVEEARSTSQGTPKFKRETVTMADSLSGYVCVNVSEGSVIVDTTNITTFENVTDSDFCSSEFCLTSVCGNRCLILGMEDDMYLSGSGKSDVFCISKIPSSCLDKFYSADNITTQLMHNSCALPTGPPTTPITLPDVCEEPHDWCATQEHADICGTCVHNECDLDYCLINYPDLECICGSRKRSAERGELYFSYQHRNHRSMESSNGPSESECEIVILEVICRELLNSTDNDSFTPLQVPSNFASHTQPTTECTYGDLEEIGEFLLPSGWFYVNSDTKHTICMERIEAPTTTPPPPTAPPPQFIQGDMLTECEPVPNDFNPCEDLLGNSDFLRAAIWFVIIFGVLGNGLVLFVFVTYTVIIRKMKVRFFPMHFLYANLATADFMMSVYLLTIASVDAHTKGRFSVHDVEWRTGPGCGFAGFCAITSTVVSVYTLVVITSERLYTITLVMSRRKFTKQFALVVMVCGWILGIVMGMLPLVGVNSYELVAVCLPFDNEGPGLAYIVIILLMTGLAFVYIAICYAIIFYQVILSPTKRKLVRSGGQSKQWKADLRMSIRMFVLVVTNFVCWFPIALVSLTAAFGVPLQGINVATAKVFVVFVFPLNACVNPFLYTLSTRAFKQNFFTLLSRCGLCRDSSYATVNSRLFGLPSVSSARTTDTTASRRSSVISQLVALNFTMFTNRRTSTVSNDFSNSNTNLNRPSQISMGSNDNGIISEDAILNQGNTFGQSSNEYQSSVQVAPQILPLTERPRNALTSASSLGTLQEVDEVSDLMQAETTIRLNPGYIDQDVPECDDYKQQHTSETDADICNEHALVNSTFVGEGTINNNGMSKDFQEDIIPNNVLQVEGDSEEISDTMSDPDNQQDPSHSQCEDD